MRRGLFTVYLSDIAGNNLIKNAMTKEKGKYHNPNNRYSAGIFDEAVQRVAESFPTPVIYAFLFGPLSLLLQ